MASRSRVWHPNTQMSEWNKFGAIRSAKGVWLTDSRGQKMIDAVASMWCNVWGHSDPELVGAIASQAKKLQHAPLFNLTHKPAEELAGMLVKMSPGMDMAFYSDNGSSAMEVAVKMALQYWANVGEPKRTKVAALKNGYHGDTFGAMSVGYVPEFFSGFKGKLFRTVRFRAPGEEAAKDSVAQILYGIEKRLAAGDVAAFVMESGAQVAGGVVIYARGFQREVGRICKKHGTLLVLDEIATGFGRMGAMVQYVEQGCRPDIVSYGKMLTGGYLTMAATLASKRVYGSFLGEFGSKRHLFHGHTYTGNPIAAAAAVKNLEMYKRRGLLKKIAESSRALAERAPGFQEIGCVADVRHRGLLMGIELAGGGALRVSPNKAFFEAGRRNGIYLRTLGSTVMLVPPLAITPAEVNLMAGRATTTIRQAGPGAMGGATPRA